MQLFYILQLNNIVELQKPVYLTGALRKIGCAFNIMFSVSNVVEFNELTCAQITLGKE